MNPASRTSSLGLSFLGCDMEAIKQTFHRDEPVMRSNRCMRDLVLPCEFCEGRRDFTPFFQFQKFLNCDLRTQEGGSPDVKTILLKTLRHRFMDMARGEERVR